MIPLPAGVVPVEDVTTRGVLYGSRSTSYRYELLSHGADGRDTLAGYLDGVSAGALSWSSGRSVKKYGNLTVKDVETAQAGLIRIRDVDLVTARIRPVRVIEGLPDEPLSTYLLAASPDAWTDGHRELALELQDRSTVLDQDAVEGTFTAETGIAVLSIVKTVVASAGEWMDVDLSDDRELGNPMVWEAGTTKLRIVNDLLHAIGYDSLWVDRDGEFQATPYVRPASRSIRYTILNDDGDPLVRELVDGDESIYQPEWTRDRDTYRVPNKVVAVATGTGDEPPLSGTATNEDPDSPFSYPSRGRWIVDMLDGVEVPDYSGEVDPDAATVAFLEARAQQSLLLKSAVQAAVHVSCLPIPIELLDAMRFASTPAGIDARHTVQRVEMDLVFDGLMRLNLQEVIDL